MHTYFKKLIFIVFFAFSSMGISQEVSFFNADGFFRSAPDPTERHQSPCLILTEMGI